MVLFLLLHKNKNNTKMVWWREFGESCHNCTCLYYCKPRIVGVLLEDLLAHVALKIDGIDQGLRRLELNRLVRQLPAFSLFFKDAFAALWHQVVSLGPADCDGLRVLVQLFLQVVESPKEEPRLSGALHTGLIVNAEAALSRCLAGLDRWQERVLFDGRLERVRCRQRLLACMKSTLSSNRALAVAA